MNFESWLLNSLRDFKENSSINSFWFVHCIVLYTYNGSPSLFFLFGIILRKFRIYCLSESLYMHNFQIRMINMRCKVYLRNLFLICRFFPLFDSCLMRNINEKQTSTLSSSFLWISAPSWLWTFIFQSAAKAENVPAPSLASPNLMLWIACPLILKDFTHTNRPFSSALWTSLSLGNCFHQATNLHWPPIPV